MTGGDDNLPPHYWKERFDWFIELWLFRVKHDPADAPEFLSLLAEMLREDRLPKSGRQYLADALEKIAQGGDLTALLPRLRKRKAYSSEAVFGAVEQEKMRLGQERADRYIYDRIGRRFGINWTTAQKEASIGRARIRAMTRLALEKGYDEMLVVGHWAGWLKLPQDRVSGLLFGPPFEK